MNAYEQLVAIRDRLENNGASEDSIDMIDKYLDKAIVERESETNVPLAMMLKHLLRQRETLGNYAIYNDLQELIDEGSGPARRERDPDERPDAWEEEQKPKPHSFYKQQKTKDRK